MALTTIEPSFTLAPVPAAAVGGLATTSFLIDAATEKVAFIIRVPKTGTLDKFEFRTAAVAQAPVSGLKCSFQDVDLTTGDPDGTIDQFRVVTGIAANTWTVPGLITSDGTDTGTKRSVTFNDLLACVIEFESFAVGDSVNVAGLTIAAGSALLKNNYVDLFTAAWVKSTSAMPILALKYSDGTYVQINEHIYPFTASVVTTFNSGSSPDERGLIFKFPVSVEISGAWFRLGATADGSDFDIVLYDSDGTTALRTVSYDGSVKPTASAVNLYVRFSPVTLVANANYRLALKPTTVNNVQSVQMDLNSNALLAAISGGVDWHLTTRTNAGAWTETNTSRPMIGPLVTAVPSFTESGGGGGKVSTLITHSGKTDSVMPLAFVQLTVSTASVGLPSIPAKARGAIITGDGSTNDVRWRADGTAPTASSGVRFTGASDVLAIESRAFLDAIRFIREDAVDVVLNIQYFELF